MTDIYLIRHAESYGNLTRRAYGWYDGLVTPKGYEQIKCLEKRFEDISVDAVYSSDLTRTCETAGAIYKPKNLPLIRERDFREIGFGVWEDIPWGIMPALDEKAYRDWSHNPLEFRIEGGETYHDVYARAKRSLDRAARENDGKTIAIISHGATLRMLMHGITNNDDLSEVTYNDWGDNTCVSRFTYENGKYTEVFKNDNSHLADMEGYRDNMNWVREGGGRNVWFELAEYPRDRDKIRAYHREAWLSVFGDELGNIKDVDKKAKRVLSKDKENIAFGRVPDGEVGIIVTDDDINVYPAAGHISLLYLLPEFRRMRYGIQLIGHAMSRYKRMGKKHLSVRVAEENTAAYDFYKKYGFYEAFREKEGKIRQIVMLLDI